MFARRRPADVAGGTQDQANAVRTGNKQRHKNASNEATRRRRRRHAMMQCSDAARVDAPSRSIDIIRMFAARYASRARYDHARPVAAGENSSTRNVADVSVARDEMFHLRAVSERTRHAERRRTPRNAAEYRHDAAASAPKHERDARRGAHDCLRPVRCFTQVVKQRETCTLLPLFMPRWPRFLRGFRLRATPASCSCAARRLPATCRLKVRPPGAACRRYFATALIEHHAFLLPG